MSFYLFLSPWSGEPTVIEADTYDLYDYKDSNFLTKKPFDTELEAQSALDHLMRLISPGDLAEFCRWQLNHRGR